MLRDGLSRRLMQGRQEGGALFGVNGACGICAPLRFEPSGGSACCSICGSAQCSAISCGQSADGRARRLPWQEVPAFFAGLSDGSITHLALRLLILTGVRSAPLRFMRLEQIEGDVWTIPGEAMKGRRDATADFRVPLSPEAMDVIAQAIPLARDGYLFPSVRKGVISDATMSRLMERRHKAERPYGFRSSLRVWLAEATETPHEIAETCLGHVVGGVVERVTCARRLALAR